MSLPPELCDLIIDELAATHQNDTRITIINRRKTLAKCLFVSRSFRNRSVRYIFRTVRVTGNLQKMTQQALSLAAILSYEERSDDSTTSQLLEIARVVEAFELSFSNVDRAKMGFVLSDANLPETTQCFANLLSIIHNHFQHGRGPTTLTFHLGHQKWRLLASSLTTNIRALVRSPHLKTLILKGIQLAPPSLLDGSSITNLTVQDFRFQFSAFESEPLRLDTIEPPRIACFNGWGYIQGIILPDFEDFICKKLFSELKILHWRNPEFEDQTHLRQILQASANSLEELNLDTFSPLLNHAGDLGIMIALQRVYLTVEGIDATLSNILHLFSVHRSLPQLQTIGLTFGGFASTPESPLPSGLTKNYCRPLDHCLTSFYYPALQAFSVHLKIDWPHYCQNSLDVRRYYTSAMKDLRELFPQLAGSVKFVTSIELV